MAIAFGIRAPRAWISLNGAKILCEEASITLSATGASSRYAVEVPLDLLLANGWTLSSLSTQKEISAQVYISNDINSDQNGVQMISGLVDDIETKLPDMVALISGRDLSAPLHNNLNTTQYLNQTAVQIVTTIAGNYGLSVSGSSQGMVGKQYTTDYVKMFDGESDWSAIQALANIEGYAAYIMTNGTLYFGQPGQNGGSYSANYQPPTPESPASGDFLAIALSANLALGSDVTATASAFDPRQNKNFTATATCAGNGGSKMNYECRAANATQAQLQKLARTRVYFAVRHEQEVEAELVGDNALVAGMTLSISGTQSEWDNSYAVDTVTHAVGANGYVMSVMARGPGPGRTIS
jgi:Phage tail baseplate hub (GPD)